MSTTAAPTGGQVRSIEGTGRASRLPFGWLLGAAAVAWTIANVGWVRANRGRLLDLDGAGYSAMAVRMGRVRSPGGVWRVKMFKAYGANPSPMELKEVFVALQTGVMDGQENPLTQIYSQKFQEVQKYLSLTGHVYTPAYLTAGASWSRLPPDVQKTLADTAREVEPDILKLAAKLDGELIGKMKQSGIQVNEANKPAFVAASKAVYDEFAKEVPTGKDLIDKSLALAKGS